MSAHEADAVRLAAQHALQPMSVAIAELRTRGHHELADGLTRVKEEWARRAMHYATAVSLMPSKAAQDAPAAEVVALPQRAGSRARPNTGGR